MSDLMLCGVLRIPLERQLSGPIERAQLQSRMIEAADELEKRAARITALEQQLADARKSERKRCAKVCDEWQLAGNAATAIRAMKDA